MKRLLRGEVARSVQSVLETLMGEVGGESLELCITAEPGEARERLALEREALVYSSAIICSRCSIRDPRIWDDVRQKMNCCVWTKNSISQMPPHPSLTSWPGTTTC